MSSSSDKPARSKPAKANSQHGSGSTGPQTGGTGSRSSSANAGTTPSGGPSLSANTRRFLARDPPAPNVTPADAGVPSGEAEVPTDDLPAEEPEKDLDPIAEMAEEPEEPWLPRATDNFQFFDSAFMRTFLDVSKRFSFDTKEVSHVIQNMPKTNDLESWKSAIDYMVLRLTPITGFKSIFHTREVTFPYKRIRRSDMLLNITVDP